MIKKAREGLEAVLCHNDTMGMTQEIEEDIQHQEEAWGEDERDSKSQESAEELNKQA